jgi:hypothetical protein
MFFQVITLSVGKNANNVDMLTVRKSALADVKILKSKYSTSYPVRTYSAYNL